MQFESKRTRTLWMTAVLGCIPDILIAVIVAAVFDGGILGFFVALIGLQVLYFLVWIKNSIWAWVG